MFHIKHWLYYFASQTDQSFVECNSENSTERLFKIAVGPNIRNTFKWGFQSCLLTDNK